MLSREHNVWQSGDVQKKRDHTAIFRWNLPLGVFIFLATWIYITPPRSKISPTPMVHTKNYISNRTYRKGEIKIMHKKTLLTAMMLTEIVNSNIVNKSCQLPQCIKKCHLQFLHTVAITALTQFCDFCGY